jgi:hypothetical protein
VNKRWRMFQYTADLRESRRDVRVEMLSVWEYIYMDDLSCSDVEGSQVVSKEHSLLSSRYFSSSLEPWI